MSMYMLFIEVFGLRGFVSGAYYPQVWLLLAMVPASSFVLNVLLLVGMQSWFILPAAVISMFINIPWVTGKSL